MTPDEFIRKWKNVELNERAAAQSHFIDLCRMLGEPAPTDADPTGEWYAFERGATKTTGGEGWADVWKRDHFGWEYKGKRKDLKAAFAQLQQYALALENPPLLVVCDMDRFEIHTNWTNSVSAVHEFGLGDLRDANVRQKLKWAFSDPEQLKPGKTRQTLTEEAAAEFAKLAQRLRDRGHPAEVVAHFINRLVFCMFAEDVDLLPNKMFKRMLEHASSRPEEFHALASDLFKAMQSGGRVGFEHVAWFNGGLFNDDTALPLDQDDIALALVAANMDWAEIDPSILGTLFERGLDPGKRSQLGAHYTDREKIMMIVNPVIVQPWLADWENTKSQIAKAMSDVTKAQQRTPSKQSEARKVFAAARRAEETARRSATGLFIGFLDRLRSFRVLDPACGSGNFLYLALLALKDIEHRANIEAELLGLTRQSPGVGPEAVLGIEVNPYAAELARVSVWIGELQWMRRNGFGVSDRPILKPLDNIQCGDAVLNPDGTETIWPAAHTIIGNPPFLGDRQHRLILGDSYTERLREAYAGRVPARADLVVYWVQKAAELLLAGSIDVFGLVATKSIAKGASRRPLDLLTQRGQTIFDAWTNEPWVVEGAAVRVSIVCAALSATQERIGAARSLNGAPAPNINPDLTSGIDVTRAARLTENRRVAFQGVKLTGPFDFGGDEARALLTLPLNPNGRPNADVISRLYDIDDIVGRDSDRWCVDFGTTFRESEASLYEAPFAIVRDRVVPFRSDPEKSRSDEERLTVRYWEFQRPRPEMRRALVGRDRLIVTPESSEHRVFVFVPNTVRVQGSLFAIARDDDVTFGILSSRIHEIWSTAQGNRLGQGNQRRYNIGVTFETFPFPEGLSPDIAASEFENDARATRIAEAARRLNTLRLNWLNPTDLVRQEPEVVPGFPDRIVPINEDAAAILRRRTLTDLYNQRPVWLANAHADLDAAVAAAYGWRADISEEDALANLLELNQARGSVGAELLPETSD
ncbi:class I SAM-dependent DNA methyltransferase [Bradyrhizobium elkanii]|uniref:class I SAM-dependent DNA methyltransferase n=1 Tax=Bradyrhizobium elkanii TaxID=29448 RepID=UPI000842190E|nr:DNA methyltransferase [Bradyrhizobium elkanii]ODM70509.1 DNA methyltransferase [Bradyrhizobium elkanii]ODM79945.1 DNA methyltransferase [Bradyrhizobium elkanii]